MQLQNIGGREVYLEFQRVGDYVKVSAIDAETNIESSIVGASRTTQQQLTRLAVRKLEYVMEKRRRADNTKADRGTTV
ncbi:MAG: serine hydroxymethyltransferase [Proteobacteria bacterium]|nr:serine hydroxymethyltransferase [Pseudomonadota bacterium]MDA1356791.1 serine hydroxymethyltransferase [Pseudomonadota bacterium]